MAVFAQYIAVLGSVEDDIVQCFREGGGEEFWAEDFTAGNPLTVLTVTHAVQGSDMILVHGNYQVIDRGEGTLVGSGRFAHIWNRSAGGRWLLDRDLWNEPFQPYQQ